MAVVFCALLFAFDVVCGFGYLMLWRFGCVAFVVCCFYLGYRGLLVEQLVWVSVVLIDLIVALLVIDDCLSAALLYWLLILLIALVRGNYCWCVIGGV